jgi:fibronectin type 3 domain-containing protein
LNPGQSATLSLQFDPTVAGAVNGQLTVTSNSSTNGTAVISLSDSVAGYDVYRSTGGSTAYQLLNSSVDTETSYVDGAVQAGATYDYIVKSVDASGVESASSNLASVTIP